MLKIMSNRNPQGKMRCITLSDDAYEWIKQFSKENDKSVSLMLELMIRSKMFNKRLDHLVDYDLFRRESNLSEELIQRPAIQSPDIVQPLE